MPWYDIMTINLYHIYYSKVSTRHKIYIRLDELINVASDFDIIFDLVVKFNQALKIVLFDDKKIEYQNGSVNDNNQCQTDVRCAFRTVIFESLKQTVHYSIISAW
jgi:hypothetical protein